MNHRPQGRDFHAPLLYRFLERDFLRLIKEFFFIFFEALSVPVFLIPVLCPGLPVMASLAQSLPVVPIPEQDAVTAVGLDMVNHGCFRVPSHRHAFHTERMDSEVLPACLLPGSPIPAAPSTPDFLRVERFVFFAVLLPGIHQFRASRMAAWDFDGILPPFF